MAQTKERSPLAPDSPSLKEVTPDLNLALWNGLFVHKDTPDDVRKKIAAVAEKTMASDRAQELANQTGAFVYWKDADASNAQIEADMEVMSRMAEILQ